MRTRNRSAGWAAVAACTVALAACGGSDDEAGSSLDGPAPTTLTPGQTQDPNLPSVEGYLISANTEEVVLRTGEGEQTFKVAQQDVGALGIEHMASHAGIETLGFRVFFEQRGDERFVKRASEIPPPALDATP